MYSQYVSNNKPTLGSVTTQTKKYIWPCSPLPSQIWPRNSAPGRKRMKRKEQARRNFTSADCSLQLPRLLGKKLEKKMETTSTKHRRVVSVQDKSTTIADEYWGGRFAQKKLSRYLSLRQLPLLDDPPWRWGASSAVPKWWPQALKPQLPMGNRRQKKSTLCILNELNDFTWFCHVYIQYITVSVWLYVV